MYAQGEAKRPASEPALFFFVTGIFSKKGEERFLFDPNMDFARSFPYGWLRKGPKYINIDDVVRIDLGEIHWLKEQKIGRFLTVDDLRSIAWQDRLDDGASAVV